MKTIYRTSFTVQEERPLRDTLDAVAAVCYQWVFDPKRELSAIGTGRITGLANTYDAAPVTRPTETIRVAFAWDKEARKVIIGFIGQHQRNRNS